MKADIFLFLIMFVFMHWVRYVELRKYTILRSFKDYMNIDQGITYMIIVIQIILFMGFEFLKLTS
jgi:hypothetical protein